MAKRATLSSVPSYLPGTTSASAINASDDALNAAFDNTLSLDGSTPNAMTVDFDMNNQDILNAKNVNAVDIVVGGLSLIAQVTAAAASATAAAASATAAAASAAAAITLGIDDNATALVMTIDASERILIGTTVPDVIGSRAGSVTISTGDSGVTISPASADELTLESNGVAGLAILTPNTSSGAIMFGDPENRDIGKIIYDHSNDSLKFVINGSQSWLIDSGGRFLTGVVTPDAVGVERGSMTVSTGNSGLTTPNADADDLILENNGNVGITIASSANNNGAIYFADSADDNVGMIDYDHNVNTMVLTAAAAARLQLDANTGTTVGTGSAGAGKQTVELMIGGIRYKLLHDGAV